MLTKEADHAYLKGSGPCIPQGEVDCCKIWRVLRVVPDGLRVMAHSLGYIVPTEALSDVEPIPQNHYIMCYNIPKPYHIHHRLPRFR